ncbi:LysR family transcriptional regulator, partial [Klebsiella pneumoniae]|nr:LysR family transcriptional regulator [Klebsiella pneumoniae]
RPPGRREFSPQPLLIPGPGGRGPPARADGLRQPLRAALAALEQAVAPVSPFDPATAAETLRVGGTGQIAPGHPPAVVGGVRPGPPR